MTDREPQRLIEMLADKTANPTRRARAARRLAQLDAQGALAALIEAAQDQQVDNAVSRAAGAAVARLLLRRGELDRVPLEDFTGGAYLAYDEAVSKHLHGTRRPAAGDSLP